MIGGLDDLGDLFSLGDSMILFIVMVLIHTFFVLFFSSTLLGDLLDSVSLPR